MSSRILLVMVLLAFFPTGYASSQERVDVKKFYAEAEKRGVERGAAKYLLLMTRLNSIERRNAQSAVDPVKSINVLTDGRRTIGFSSRSLSSNGLPPDLKVYAFLADSKPLQKEIELVASQREQLRDLLKLRQKRMKDVVESDDFFAEVSKIDRELDLRNKFDSILLEHQKEFLTKYWIQIAARNEGLVRSLTQGTLSSVLEVSDEQKKKVVDSAEELKQEFEDELKELTLKYRKKVLSNLNARQKKKLEDALSDSGGSFENATLMRYHHLRTKTYQGK